MKKNANLNIDSDFYNGIVSDYNQIISDLNQCISLENGNMLTNQLRSYYNQLGTSSAITSGISHLVVECESIKIKINAGVETCNSADEEMKWQLESLMDNLFTDNTISSSEYMGSTYEERVNYVNDLIVSSENVLKQLEETYKDTFGNGINMDKDKAECFVNLLTALGAFDLNNDNDKSLFGKAYSKTVYNEKTGCFNIEQLGYVIDFCNDSGVVSSLRKYVKEGNSWEESGLDNLFGNNLKKTTFGFMYGNGIYVDDYDSLDAENIFIQKYINLYCNKNEQGFSDIIYMI